MPGACDPMIIGNLVNWVVEDDADAREKFGNAVRNGQSPYSALIDRLGHDENAQNVIRKCVAEARMALASRGYP